MDAAVGSNLMELKLYGKISKLNTLERSSCKMLSNIKIHEIRKVKKKTFIPTILLFYYTLFFISNGFFRPRLNDA